MEKQIETNPQWQCVRNNPSVWVLGSLEGVQIVNLHAVVSRESDGRWRWTTLVFMLHGIEPTRIFAMQSVERATNQIAIK